MIEGVSGAFQKKMWLQVSNEDHTVAYVHFEGGRRAQIELSSLAAVNKSMFRILGTRGGIEMKSFDEKDKIQVVSTATACATRAPSRG